VLICQRKYHDAFPGKWEFPGGKIETGEEPQAALARELGEELGILAIIGEEISTIDHQYPGRPLVRLHFFDVVKFEGQPQNRVFNEVCWALPRDLAGYDFLEADKPLIERLATGELGHRDP
jgi:8-oxo-dGTP diphosphatase